MKIFTTGATGFLGYHIAKHCIAEGFELLCLKRTSSVSLFEPNQEKLMKWVNSDEEGWEKIVVDYQPDILIHCAWEGVSAENRNNPQLQSGNVQLSKKLIKLFPYKQIVVLGSQEEYGQIDCVVDENFPLIPITEYAKSKIKTCKILQEYAENKGIEWQWIRVFTVFGEQQKQDWLIPSMISKCLDPGVPRMDTTKGEQSYSYLYSSDFANAIISVLGKAGSSGIYNISSSTPTKLMDLFLLIKKKTNSQIKFNPILPYREFQSMLIMGDSSKFKKTFGDYEKTTLSQGLDRIIQTIVKRK